MQTFIYAVLGDSLLVDWILHIPCLGVGFLKFEFKLWFSVWIICLSEIKLEKVR
jgi:hypothetical protein